MITSFFIVDQGGAGTTEIAPAMPGHKIAVLNYSVILSADGTFAWSDGTDWLSGDMPIYAKGGVSANAGTKGRAGPHDAPLMLGGAGRPLQITTTGGSAHGHVTVEYQ